jgi:hypothetical protein
VAEYVIRENASPMGPNTKPRPGIDRGSVMILTRPRGWETVAPQAIEVQSHPPTRGSMYLGSMQDSNCFPGSGTAITRWPG